MCQKPSNSRSIRDPEERKGCVQLGRLLYQQNYSRTGQFMRFCGLFTLHQNGVGNRTANGTGTIDNSGSWLLSLSCTSVNISTWYYTFHLISTQVPVPFPCSVNIPQAVDLLFVTRILYCNSKQQENGFQYLHMVNSINYLVISSCYQILFRI